MTTTTFSARDIGSLLRLKVADAKQAIFLLDRWLQLRLCRAVLCCSKQLAREKNRWLQGMEVGTNKNECVWPNMHKQRTLYTVALWYKHTVRKRAVSQVAEERAISVSARASFE
eukprot:COSAG03_NODE_145_length_11619_cov_4.863281_5_plen_114_part_00